jgi:asparagine N-glycosylation enzyme membrane subunit Stt3
MILLASVNNMIDMFYLRDNTCHVLLVSTMIFFMMIIWLNKYMYDIMIILVTSFLWIKLNVYLPKFLTVGRVVLVRLDVSACLIGFGRSDCRFPARIHIQM